MVPMHRIGRALLAPLLLLSLAGCSQEPAATAAAAEGATPGAEPLLFAVAPWDTPSRLFTRYAPLVDYLATTLEQPVHLYIATSYDDQIRRIARGQVDLAHMGPTPYLRARDRRTEGDAAPVRLVAAEAPYIGVLITRNESDVLSAADLAGRTVAFGSHHSLAGHYIPRVMLLREGVTLADLTDYAYLDRHERVVLAVLHGDFDAGGTTLGIARKYAEREPGLRILDLSPPLPPLAIVARPGLPEPLFRQIRRALINPDFDGELAIGQLGPEVRFHPVEEADYDFARGVVERIERDTLEEPLPW